MNISVFPSQFSVSHQSPPYVLRCKAMAVHILVFPFPAQGHMLPLLDLAHRLATHPNFRLTILTTPKNLPSLSPLLSLHSSIETLILPLPPHPSLPPGVENVRDVGNSGNIPIISSLHRLRDPILQWFRSHPDPPAAILSDFFLGWTSHLGIPRIALFSSGAFLTSVSYHCWENLETVRSTPDAVSFPDLPGAPSFKEEHLPSIFRYYKESDPDWELVRDSMLANISSSWGCVINSFDALEGDYIHHLRRIAATGRVYGVGPLSLTGLTHHNPDRVVCVTDWLDGCPDGSVLYVCFGSQKLMTAEQLEAIASALEKSGVRFLWVVKSKSVDGTGSGILEGFEKRVAGRGKVINGWVQQVEIMNHRAVGYFLSHCGWNSLQEAIVGGVAVLAWPMEADQYVNARLLVEDMGVAVQVCEGADTVPDADELGRAIYEFVREEDSEEKTKAKALRGKAVAAVAAGGSSACEFDRLVKDLCSLVQEKHITIK